MKRKAEKWFEEYLDTVNNSAGWEVLDWEHCDQCAHSYYVAAVKDQRYFMWHYDHGEQIIPAEGCYSIEGVRTAGGFIHELERWTGAESSPAELGVRLRKQLL